MAIVSVGTPWKRKRRRHWRSSVEECYLPCSAWVCSGGITTLTFWLWSFHKLLSYTPEETTIYTTKQRAVTVQRSEPPIFPPDMMSDLLSVHQFYNDTCCTSINPLMVTWKSNQHVQNQDRAFVYKRFVHNQLPSQDDGEGKSFLVGVFDGHGRDGHFMADFVVQHFATTLAEQLNSRPCCQPSAWITSKLVETFVQMEQMAVNKSPSLDFAYTGGCTASVTLRIGNHLFFANAGDSKTMLASDFGETGSPNDPYTATVRFSTRLDKADIPEERARIERLGGTIHFPPPEKRLTSRVILHSTHLADSVGLAMSRSLGDHEWTGIGVIPEPLVNVIRLDQHGGVNPYLIVASDGLWDCRARRPQFFAKQLGAMLFKEPPLSHTEATKEVVHFLNQITPQQPQWYRDDITVVALRL